MVNPVLILLFYKFSAEMNRAVHEAKVLPGARGLLSGSTTGTHLTETGPQMWCPQLESCVLCRVPAAVLSSELRHRSTWLDS